MNLEAQHYNDHSEVKSKLIDPFAREINYLRLSVTDRCDFRCLYMWPLNSIEIGRASCRERV